MALQTPSKLFTAQNGNRKLVIYDCRNFNASDTVQTSADFSRLISAWFLALTGPNANAAGAVLSVSSNTTVTIPGAAYVTNDDGYLIVEGASA